MTQTRIRLGSVLLVAALLAALAPAVRPQALSPCSITAISPSTGIVSAKVNASGAVFQFKVTDAKLLASLHVGQGVYANFTAMQVSLDGKKVCCEITSPPQTPASPPASAPAAMAAPKIAAPPAGTPAPAAAAKIAAAPSANASAANPAPAVSAAAPTAVSTTGNNAAPPGPTSTITAMDTNTGLVTAKETATGKTFQFKLDNPAQLSTVKVGQGVYANFDAGQVSLDGLEPSGQITATSAATTAATRPSASSAAAQSKPGSTSAASTLAKTPAIQGAAAVLACGGSPGASQSLPGSSSASAKAAEKKSTTSKTTTSPAAPTGQPTAEQPCIPTLSYGTPQPVSTVMSARLVLPHPPSRWEARTITAVVAGKSTTANILHLRGLDGIQEAQALPDAARDFLILHVKALPAGESDSYIVNLELANTWAKTHPVPPSATPTAPKSDGTAGCDSFSWHCAQEAGQHAIDQASQQADALREQAQKDWATATGDAEKLWNAAGACFNEDSLSLNNIPVEFNAKPSFGETLTESGSTKSGNLSLSGTATGKVNLAIPFGGNFQASFAVAFIPCLPFVVRPQSMGADGDLTIGSTLTASINATGKFDYPLTIPPSGIGPKIPLEVIPIVIFGVPIAEMDVSAYFEGGIDVSGSGKLTANFELDNPHEAAFNFLCSGSGCTGTWKNVKVPTTTSENVQLNGQIDVTPDVYTAIQLDFDIDAISVRSGPEPHLYGVLSGCVGASATQTLGGGPSSSQEWHLLAGDVDWDVKLRTELLLGGTAVGNPLMNTLYGRTHLWYSDLWPGGSNALDPVVAAPTQVVSGKAATYNVSMPSCYPYPDKVTYKVTWTGNAAGSNAGGSTGCLVGNGAADCVAAPATPFGVDFTWPSGGSDSLTVILERDAHGRIFKTAQPTQLSVDVRGQTISVPAATARP